MGLPLLLGAIGSALVGLAFAGRARRAAGANAERRRREGTPPRGRHSILPTPTPAPAAAPPATDSPAWPGWPAPDAPIGPSVPSVQDGRSREHQAADDTSAEAPVAHGGGTVQEDGTIRPPGLDEWAALLAPLCVAAGVQLPYALTWTSMESGGNPCAVGYPPSKGPDGAPLEMGIGQFYNPDDLRRLRLTSTELRAYCVPGDDHETTFKGRKVRGFSQQMSRRMTPKEMATQAEAQVELITSCMADASQMLTRIGAGAAWSRTRRDFWRLVKLVHGLPTLISEGMPRINAKLGRPPRDWAEFRKMLGEVTLGARAEQKRAAGLVDASLDNAERCAAAYTERSVA